MTTERGRLIIVDDEPVILHLLGSVFEDQPFDVVCCASGAEALAAMAEGIDVLLTDKNLPDLNGLELVRRCAEDHPDAECLIITGYASLETALEAMQLDVFGYIVKPPKNIFDVQRTVRQAWAKVQVVRQNRALLSHLQLKNAELESAVAELTELQAELVQSEKLAGIGTLAAGIAHEVSSPLFGVMGLAEAILDEDDVPTIHQHATEIVEYSRNIKDIVVQLSGYSRSAQREYLTTIDLPSVVRDAAKLVTRSTPIDAERVVLDLQDGTLHARTSEVQQVFVNLIKNAVEAVLERYGPDGGSITVQVAAGDRFVEAWVRDDGAGIPPDQCSLIFDPFFTTKPPGRGTGLGLNIVYRIVTKYHGTVSVQSVVGEGTTFHVRFPVGA